MLFFNKTKFSVFFLLVAYCVCLSLFENNFKLGLVITFVFIGLIQFLTKDFFISVFSIFVLATFFFLPAKIYTFVYASANQYVYELLKEGIFETVGLDISDVLNILLILWFVRERLRGTQDFIKILNSGVVISILSCWGIYFAFSLFSSLNYSVFPGFSINVLFKYSKIVTVFLGTSYFLLVKRKQRDLFFITLLAILSFQCVVGVLQFSNSLSAFGQSERLPSLDVEENTGFSRVKGISDHPNGHALTTSLLLVMTLPYIVKEKKKVWVLVIILSILNIIFSQSRTVWFSFFLPAALVLTIHHKKIVLFIRDLLNEKRTTTILLLFAGILFLFIAPRLSTVQIFFSDTGGSGLREEMIIQGWQLLQQSPWVGFGVGMGVRIFLDKYLNGYASTFPFPVHFAYLQIALESGILGSVAFFFPIYIIIRSSISHLKKEKSLKALSVICCVMIMLQYYLIQPIAGRREYVFLGLLLGIGTTLILEKPTKESIHVIE